MWTESHRHRGSTCIQRIDQGWRFKTPHVVKDVEFVSHRRLPTFRSTYATMMCSKSSHHLQHAQSLDQQPHIPIFEWVVSCSKFALQFRLILCIHTLSSPSHACKYFMQQLDSFLPCYLESASSRVLLVSDWSTAHGKSGCALHGCGHGPTPACWYCNVSLVSAR